MATLSATGEIVFPMLLVFGLATRFAALGTLGMTAIIFLTYPEHWPSEGLPWAAMSLAIMAFGPGRIAFDALVARLIAPLTACADGRSAPKGAHDLRQRQLGGRFAAMSSTRSPRPPAAAIPPTAPTTSRRPSSAVSPKSSNAR